MERVAANIDYILAGHEGEPGRKPPFHMPAPQQDEEGNTIWMRDAPHPGDAGPKDPEAKLHMRVSRYADCEVKYDDRFVFENRGFLLTAWRSSAGLSFLCEKVPILMKVSGLLTKKRG